MAIDYCLGAENETLAEIGESKLPPDKKKSTVLLVDLHT